MTITTMNRCRKKMTTARLSNYMQQRNDFATLMVNDQIPRWQIVVAKEGRKYRTDLLRMLLLYRIAECSKIRFAG